MNREPTFYRFIAWGNVFCAVLSLVTALLGGLRGVPVWITYATAIGWAACAAMNFYLVKKAAAKRQHTGDKEERQQ